MDSHLPSQFRCLNKISTAFFRLNWDVQTGERLRTMHSEGPYAGMNITGATGLTETQKAALKVLGAEEDVTFT